MANAIVQLNPGVVIDRWTIEKKLGEGGFGAVYRVSFLYAILRYAKKKKYEKKKYAQQMNTIGQKESIMEWEWWIFLEHLDFAKERNLAGARRYVVIFLQ